MVDVHVVRALEQRNRLRGFAQAKQSEATHLRGFGVFRVLGKRGGKCLVGTRQIVLRIECEATEPLHARRLGLLFSHLVQFLQRLSGVSAVDHLAELLQVGRSRLCGSLRPPLEAYRFAVHAKGRRKATGQSGSKNGIWRTRIGGLPKVYCKKVRGEPGLPSFGLASSCLELQPQRELELPSHGSGSLAADVLRALIQVSTRQARLMWLNALNASTRNWASMLSQTGKFFCNARSVLKKCGPHALLRPRLPIVSSAA